MHPSINQSIDSKLKMKKKKTVQITNSPVLFASKRPFHQIDAHPNDIGCVT